MKDDRTGLDVASVGDAEGVAALVGLDAPTADASLEALGRIVRAAWVEVAKKEAKTVPGYVDLWEWLEIPDADTDREIGEQVVRAVDASRPAAPVIDAEDLWTDYRTGRGTVFASDRKAFLAGVAAGRRTVDASRPGLTEEQARAWERLRTAATTAVEAYEDSDADEAFEPLFVALDEALGDLATIEEESASRGETGPAPAGLTRAERVAEAQRLRAEARAEADACTVPMPADLLARYPRSADPPEPDRPSGLTAAMHDAAQRPSAPPDLGPGIGGAPIRIRPTGAPDPCATPHADDPQKSGGDEQ